MGTSSIYKEPAGVKEVPSSLSISLLPKEPRVRGITLAYPALELAEYVEGCLLVGHAPSLASPKSSQACSRLCNHCCHCKDQGARHSACCCRNADEARINSEPGYFSSAARPYSCFFAPVACRSQTRKTLAPVCTASCAARAGTLRGSSCASTTPPCSSAAAPSGSASSLRSRMTAAGEWVRRVYVSEFMGGFWFPGWEKPLAGR